MKNTMTMRALQRAQIVNVLPCVAQMNAQELEVLALDSAAVEAVMAQKGEQMTMHGASAGVTLSGMQVVAKKAIDRFYELLAPIDAFSTTYTQDYIVTGQPGILPKVVVPVYDDTSGAQVDNYDSFATRTDGGKVSGAEIVLHKVDKVIKIYGRDIQQGVDIEKRIESALSSIAREVQKQVFKGLKVGVKQADDSSKAVSGITVPAIGSEDGAFNFGYVNQVLSEAIQPRTNALLVDSAHYGALKASTKDSLTASDLDVDAVHKVQDSAEMGEKCCGLLVNKRGAAVGLAAPYMLRGAYASYEQFTRNGQNCPIACCTWYEPNENCIKIWLGVMVGVAVTDVDAVKPLLTA